MSNRTISSQSIVKRRRNLYFPRRAVHRTTNWIHSVLDSSAFLLSVKVVCHWSFVEIYQRWTQFLRTYFAQQAKRPICWNEVILFVKCVFKCWCDWAFTSFSSTFGQKIGFNMTTLTLTFPQIVAHNVTGALPVYYSENIIFKALINMYNSPTSQKVRAALYTRTSTVTVPWREHSYEMPHWIWVLCWDTGAARLCGIYNVMKKNSSVPWPVSFGPHVRFP